MKVRLLVAAGAALLATAPSALAHHDTSPTDPRKGEYCDSSDDRGSHKGSAAPSDLVVTFPGGWELWAPGGHYVLRKDASNYVEVVGGQSYNYNGNQGGYVQGSLKPDGAPASVDFHANAFAGNNSPNTSQFACVNVNAAGQRQRVATPGRQP